MTQSCFSGNHDTLTAFSVYSLDTVPRVLLAPQTAESRLQEIVGILPYLSGAGDRIFQRLLKKTYLIH